MLHLATGIYEAWFGEKRCNLLFVGADGAGKSTLVEQIKAMWNPSNIAHRPVSRIASAAARTTIRPTVGLNMARLHRKDINTNVALWDLGGQSSLRALWVNYFPQCHGVIFVVDAATLPARAAEVSALLRQILCRPDLATAPMAILLNKTDLLSAQDRNMSSLLEHLDIVTAFLQARAVLLPIKPVPSAAAGNSATMSSSGATNAILDHSHSAAESTCGFGVKVWRAFSVSAATGDGVFEAMEWLVQQCQKSSRVPLNDEDP